METYGPEWDGVYDPFEIKVENFPESWAHQIAWDAEVMGYAKLAQEPRQHRSRIKRTLGWLGRALVAYDPNGNPIF
jgi:hypothetical protein